MYNPEPENFCLQWCCCETYANRSLHFSCGIRCVPISECPRPTLFCVCKMPGYLHKSHTSSFLLYLSVTVCLFRFFGRLVCSFVSLSLVHCLYVCLPASIFLLSFCVPGFLTVLFVCVCLSICLSIHLSESVLVVFVDLFLSLTMCLSL